MTALDHETVVVAHVLANRDALSRWERLRLSPECAAVLDAIYGWPDRPAAIALSLASVNGDVAPELYEKAMALADRADAVTVSELVTSPLEAHVLALQAKRLRIGRAA